MFSCPDPRRTLLAAALALAGTAALAQTAATAYPGIGRAATPKEVAAWDIDVRPDFKGLPKGSGSVAKGQDLWEAKCAACHGVFGEANEVFTPLVGGTTKDDVKTGRVARLLDTGFPGRTTLMKVATVSTLWDYIHRAMPWNAPKSLSPDEVYAVTAFLLNLAEVVPENFTLSDQNIAEVQQRMPNRNGMTLDHAMWPGKPGPLGIGKARQPDVKVVACMKDCVTESAVGSMLPDFARNAHGNLAEQSRMVGAQLGADTTRPPALLGAAPKAAVPGRSGCAQWRDGRGAGPPEGPGLPGLPRPGQQDRGPRIQRRGQEVRRAARRRGVLLPEDPVGWRRAVGSDPHARANPVCRRHEGHRTMACRRRQEVTPPDTKENPMQTRRKMLTQSAQVAGLLATAGLLPQAAQAAWSQAAFDAKTLAEAVKALGGGAPAESKDVSITGPDIAENGAVVPVGCSTGLAGVKMLALMVEKNPSALAAVFTVSDAVDASFNTRVKMGQSSNVFAVAIMNDGKVLYAAKEIKVTLGGCGG